MRDEQVVGMPRVQRLSFTATGTPAKRPGSRPSATAASTAAAWALAASALTRVSAWNSWSRLAMVASASSVVSAAVRSPRLTASASRAAGPPRAVGLTWATLGSRRFPEDGRNPEPVVLDVGSTGQDLFAVEARHRLREATDVGDRHGVRSQGNPSEIEGGHVPGLIED